MTQLVLKSQISKELEQIVQQFNEAFAAWSKKHECVANFSWGYNRDGVKKLEMTGVDMIIWRKAPPNAETLSSVMKQYDPDAKPA